jgi:hypothetical protein
MEQYAYDVTISFAGEDRSFAAALAAELQRRNVKVFYDEYEKASLWGKNPYDHLSEIYRKKARFCVIFISRYYAKKLWTNHERKAAQSRAFSEREEYILPIRLDDTEVEGVLPTTAFLSCPPENEISLADAICTKLGQKGTRPHGSSSAVS